MLFIFYARSGAASDTWDAKSLSKICLISSSSVRFVIFLFDDASKLFDSVWFGHSRLLWILHEWRDEINEVLRIIFIGNFLNVNLNSRSFFKAAILSLWWRNALATLDLHLECRRFQTFWKNPTWLNLQTSLELLLHC